MDRERVEQATVAWILAARAEYLANGASALKHWDQLQDRLRAAARMSVDVPTWCTAMSRGLQLGAPKTDRAHATGELADAVGSAATEWLDLLEAEHGYLMAMARLQSEKRRKNRKDLREELAALEREDETPKSDALF